MRWNHVDFSDIRVTHIRGTAFNTLPSLPPMMNAAMYSDLRSKYLREQEFQTTVFSFFKEFQERGGLVINPLSGSYMDHDSKSQFYEKLRRYGCVVPNCLTTNIPDKAEDFIRNFGKVVVKPAVGVGPTRIVTHCDPEKLDQLRHCPALFQEQIEGDTLRVHIVASKVVLTVKILAEGGVDSRSQTKAFRYVKLPDAEEKKIVRTNRLLGLHYSAWDMIASEDGRYVYLDCNPGPYIMWIGPKLRKHIFTQLARYMITYAKKGSREEASEQVTPWDEDDGVMAP